MLSPEGSQKNAAGSFQLYNSPNNKLSPFLGKVPNLLISS